MPEEPVTSPSGPTSWRDVYQLIQDVEERLTKRMDAQSAERRAVATDVEVRLRVLERAQLINEQSDKTSKTALGAARSILLAAVSVGALVISLASLIAK